MRLQGNVDPRARKQADAGPVEPERVLSRMILSLNRDADQQAALDSFSAALADPASPLYHQWLTPQEFGAHFGISQNDIDRITEWLTRVGFTVDEVPASHWTIIFSGTVAQVQSAFRTTLRYYRAGNETRFANADDPQIPAELNGIVVSIAGLNDFRPSRKQYAIRDGGGAGSYYLNPSDFATIYNINPLYASGITGSGVDIAVIEDCTTDVSDEVFAFWGLEGIKQGGWWYRSYGTPAACTTDDYYEVYLDYEWAGAIAPQAKIWLVSSGGDSLLGAVTGIVNSNPMPVITISYSVCGSQSIYNTWISLWQQAHTEGITGVVSSGDTGAAGCEFDRTETVAQNGLNVNGLCHSEYVTCVGGTEFYGDQVNSSAYWSATGKPLGYIPEVAWNDTRQTTLWGASGGGYSTFRAKGSWQTGNPSPYRGIPDIAFTASGAHDAYRICMRGDTCTPNFVRTIGGTSAAAPSFAGVVALLVQKAGQPQGSLNPALYALAAHDTQGLIFHDITQGDNSVAGQSGYSAGPGWDPVTGLGSVDVAALVNALTGGVPSAPIILQLSTLSLNFGNQTMGTTSASRTVTLTNTGGSAANITRIALNGANYADFPSTTNCPGNPNPGTLSAGASCVFTVTFRPSAGGARTASLVITDNAANSPQTVTLTGTGVAQTPLVPYFNQRVTTQVPPATGCIVPPAANSFVTTNSKVYLYFEATVTPSDILSNDWLAPDGTVIDDGPWPAESGNYCFPGAYLSVSNLPANQLGTWQARVWDNGQLLFTIPFTVTQSGAPSSGGLYFYPLPPCHLVDTRSGQGTSGEFGPPSMPGGQTRTFHPALGSCPGIPSTAKAYSLNITAAPARPGAGLSYLTIWPAGQAQPFVSTLNAFKGGYVSNAALVPAGSGGGVSVFVTDDADVMIDINGYFDSVASSNGKSFYPLPPCRVADTRLANGALGGSQMPAGSSRDFPLGLSNCLPSGAAVSSYSLNVTAIPAEPLGSVAIWPAGSLRPPGVSALSASFGDVTANATLAGAGANGSVSVFASNRTDVALDINGYFGTPGAAGALVFHPVAPCRVADTRNPAGPFGGPILRGATSRTINVPSSPCNIPSNAGAYSLNVTVVPAGGLGYLTLWPTGQAQPFVSTLNSFDGRVIANAAIVPAGTNGAINIFVTNDSHVVLDINGYFATE